MQGILLDRVASVWRKAASNAGGYEDTQVYSSLTCSIVPISRLDAAVPYAYESTHVVWVPYWAILRKEDQVRDGHQLPDVAGDILPWIYTINGRRDFRLGIPQIAYYARELD